MKKGRVNASINSGLSIKSGDAKAPIYYVESSELRYSALTRVSTIAEVNSRKKGDILEIKFRRQ